MKKKIIVLNNFDYSKFDLNNYEINNYSDYKVDELAEFFVCIKPKIKEFKEIIENLMVVNKNIKVVVFVPMTCFYMLKSLFPNCFLYTEEKLSNLREILEELNNIENYDTYEPIEFTVKEEMFLSELAYGLSNKELCSQLMMSDRSVRRLKEKLLSKTGLSSTQQLALYALNKGY